MKAIILWMFLTTIMPLSFAQVEWHQKKEKPRWENEKIPTQCYVEFQRTHSYRILQSNTEFLNTPLGQRADETPMYVWSYGAGILTNLGRFGRLETGIQWIQNGEGFHYSSPINDSSFHYESRYRYIGLPFAVMFTYGKKASFFIGPGLTPMLFSGFAQKTNWTNAYGSQNEERINIKNNSYASAAIQVFGQIGFQIRGDSGWGSYVKGVYRRQISNTYSKYNDFIHRAIGWGIYAGITKQL